MHLFDLIGFLGKNGGDLFIPVSQFIVSPFTVSNQAYFAKIGHAQVQTGNNSGDSGLDEIRYQNANFFS